MSTEPHHAKKKELPPPPPESPSVNARLVTLSGAAALVIFGVSVFLTYLGMEHWRFGAPKPQDEPLPPAMGQKEIGVVDQTYFPTLDYVQRGEGDERSTLDSYGWVDRSRGLIHVPVEQAMDALVSQEGGRKP